MIYSEKYDAWDEEALPFLFRKAQAAELSLNFRVAAKCYRELYEAYRRGHGEGDKRAGEMLSKYLHCEKYS